MGYCFVYIARNGLQARTAQEIWYAIDLLVIEVVTYSYFMWLLIMKKILLSINYSIKDH